jgi:O-acetyl-ADP-ribose deacetylase (regulator of RNase III)
MKLNEIMASALRSFFICAALLALSSCQSNSGKKQELKIVSQDAMAAMNAVRLEVQTTLDKLHWSLKSAAATLGKRGLNGQGAQTALKNLYSAHRDLVNCGTVDLNGKIQAAGPVEYRSEGIEKLKKQTELMKELKKRSPQMGKAFKTDSGLLAVSLTYPVITPDGQLLGNVYLLFMPQPMIARTVESEIRNIPVNIWVIQPNGLILYDRDPEEVGQNILTDKYYAPYESLREFTRMIAKQDSGTGKYEFPTKGEKNKAIKTAKWTSVEEFGSKWRIVMNMEDNALRSIMQQ